MRNLLEHPVTKDEIVLCLLALTVDFDPDLVGDMRPMLIREAIKHVRGSALKLSDLGTVQDSS